MDVFIKNTFHRFTFLEDLQQNCRLLSLFKVKDVIQRCICNNYVKKCSSNFDIIVVAKIYDILGVFLLEIVIKEKQYISSVRERMPAHNPNK